MDTLQRLRELLVPILGVEIDQIEPESAIVRDLGAESIDFVEIFYEIENQFGIKIKIQEMIQNEYLEGAQMPEDGVLDGELAAKLNHEFKTDRFIEGVTVRDLFESFTVRDLSTIIVKKKGLN